MFKYEFLRESDESLNRLVVKLQWSFDMFCPTEYGDGSLMLFEFEDDKGTGWAGLDYPISSDPNWRFWVIFEDKDGYDETYKWVLTDEEKENIKRYSEHYIKEVAV